MDDTTTPNVSTFDVLGFIEATEYPTSTVTLFRDISKGKEYARLVAERTGLPEGKTSNELDKAIANIEDELKTNSLTFELRGFAPGVVQDILDLHKDADDDSGDFDLISRTITGVYNGSGEKDSHTWTVDDVRKLKRHFAEGEYNKLLQAVAGVIFNAAVFDSAVDAGFSG